MNNEHGNKLEQRVRFVAKRYREGSLDPDKAWQKFLLVVHQREPATLLFLPV